MKICPVCNDGALVFDEYFERYRCSSPQCGYMPPSSVESALNRIKNPEFIKVIDENIEIPEMGFSMLIYHDTRLDSLVFDSNQMEPSIELPEEDGKMTWKISNITKRVIGFELFRIKSVSIQGVILDIVGIKKQLIENALKDISFRVPIQYMINQVVLYSVQNAVPTSKVNSELAEKISLLETRISEAM